MAHKPVLTRRTLLAGSALAAASAATTEAVKLPRPIRLGMIGLEGHLGEVLGQLSLAPDVELAAIYDPDPAIVAKVAADPQAAKAKQYKDYHKLLDSEKLDMVVVYGANIERPGAILAAAERKLHIVSEKPLVIERADLKKVQAAVAKNNVRMTMLLTMRSMGHYQFIRKVVQDGRIGEVVQISTQKSHKLGYRAPWMKKHSTFGGSIPYIGIHMVDFMRWSSGREFVEAASFQSHLGFPDYGDMENNMATIFRMDNKGTAVMRMDYLRPEMAPNSSDDRVRLAGTKGIVEYQAGQGVVTLMTADQKMETFKDFAKGRSMFLDFLDSVYNGKPHAISLEDIYRTSAIVLGAREAAEQNRIVKL